MSRVRRAVRRMSGTIMVVVREYRESDCKLQVSSVCEFTLVSKTWRDSFLTSWTRFQSHDRVVTEITIRTWLASGSSLIVRFNVVSVLHRVFQITRDRIRIMDHVADELAEYLFRRLKEYVSVPRTGVYVACAHKSDSKARLPMAGSSSASQASQLPGSRHYRS